jgi:putative sugar O-methyltransferase
LRIVEIGGGFGGLAYHLFKLFDGGLRYAIIDLPESLAFSSIYCTTLFPQADNRLIEGAGAFALDDTPGFTFIPNTIYKGLQTGDRPVDLVINTLSLSEMSDAQIHDYCAGVQRMIGDRGIFFEQNHQADHQGPGQLFPQHFKNLRACTSSILPADFEKRRGQANLWINASYRG